MATSGKDLSIVEKFPLTNPEKLKIGIVVAQWNNKITDRLLNGAIKALTESGIKKDNIQRKTQTSTEWSRASRAHQVVRPADLYVIFLMLHSKLTIF